MKCSLCSEKFDREYRCIVITGAGRVDSYSPICPACFAKIDRKITDILEGFGDVKLPKEPPLTKKQVRELYEDPCFACKHSELAPGETSLDCPHVDSPFEERVFAGCEHYEPETEEPKNADTN